jgi:hypothetical protein
MILYVIFALLFYLGGIVIDDSCSGTGANLKCTVDPKNVFIALFAIFFGAS